MTTKTHRSAALLAAALLLISAVSCAADTGSESPPPEQSPSESASPNPGDPRLGGELFGGANAFIMSYEATPDAAKLAISAVPRGDGDALLIDASAGGTVYVAIDAAGLLGDLAPLAATAEIDIETERPGGGEFYAVSGVLSSLKNANLDKTDFTWSVYLESKNPNTARAELPPAARYEAGGFGILLLTLDTDVGAQAGAAPATLYIRDVRFLDESGALLPLNRDTEFHAPDGFGLPDTSNLIATDGGAVIDGAAGVSAGGWGQVSQVLTAKSGGVFDASLLTADSVITVYFVSAANPNIVLQSWTDGHPDSAGWAQAAPSYVNDSRTAAQYTAADLAAAFGTDDFAAYLDALYVGDAGEKLTVYSVVIGTAAVKEAN
ncbi:MAG: hypothetical protein LBS90_06235 [Oscillospiraceae bacterium]|jgi:hypothetical protein|nr:hypothetical protein [Oscillospiraceae bacterium]